MKMRFSLLCLTLPILWPAGKLAGQTPPVPAPATEIVFMSWERAQTGLFTTQDEREFQPLSAPAYDFGKPSRVRSDAPLRIYEKVMREGRPAYAIAGEAALPPGCRSAQAYLVRMADKDGLRSYRVIAMSNDAEAFKAGEVRVFNFTPNAAMTKVGETLVSLAPLEWRTVPGGADHKYRVPLVTSLQVEGNWTRAVRNIISVRPGQRGYVTIVHTQAGIGEIGAATGQPRMMVLASSEPVPPSQGRPGNGIESAPRLSAYQK